jgi:hypothetical protein
MSKVVGRNMCARRAIPKSVSLAIIRHLAVAMVWPRSAGRIPPASLRRG